MARARLIKIGFFENEDLAQLPDKARLLFAGLWLVADRAGRLEDRPLRIRAQIFPYETVDIDGHLTELERAGFIVRYLVDGARYISVRKFLAHQSPHHREAPSRIPPIHESLGSALAPPGRGAGLALDEHRSSPGVPIAVPVPDPVPDPVPVPETVPVETATRASAGAEAGAAAPIRLAARGGKDSRSSVHVTPVDEEFSRFWARYPKHVKKETALVAWRKLRPSPTLIAAIHSALDWQTTQPGWLKNRGEYVPHAASWLNGRRWEDEPFNAPVDPSDAAFQRVMGGKGQLQ